MRRAELVYATLLAVAVLAGVWTVIPSGSLGFEVFLPFGVRAPEMVALTALAVALTTLPFVPREAPWWWRAALAAPGLAAWAYAMPFLASRAFRVSSSLAELPRLREGLAVALLAALAITLPRAGSLRGRDATLPASRFTRLSLALLLGAAAAWTISGLAAASTLGESDDPPAVARWLALAASSALLVATVIVPSLARTLAPVWRATLLPLPLAGLMSFAVAGSHLLVDAPPSWLILVGRSAPFFLLAGIAACAGAIHARIVPPSWPIALKRRPLLAAMALAAVAAVGSLPLGLDPRSELGLLVQGLGGSVAGLAGLVLVFLVPFLAIRATWAERLALAAGVGAFLVSAAHEIQLAALRAEGRLLLLSSSAQPPLISVAAAAGAAYLLAHVGAAPQTAAPRPMGARAPERSKERATFETVPRSP